MALSSPTRTAVLRMQEYNRGVEPHGATTLPRRDLWRERNDYSPIIAQRWPRLIPAPGETLRGLPPGKTGPAEASSV
jgi:hypothetical protein